MLCILCLTKSDQRILIFGDEGQNLNANQVITKHFWLQPSAEDANRKEICCSCWNVLYSFHKFYEEVETAHAKLLNAKPLIDVSDQFTELNTDFFSEDVKLEAIEDAKPEFIEVNPEPESIRYSTETLKSDHDESDTGEDSTKNDDSDTESDMDSCNNDDAKNSDGDSDYKPNKIKPKRKVIPKLDSTFNYEKVTCKEFDAVIKNNMDLSCEICHLPLNTFFILKEHYRTAHKQDGFVSCCDKKYFSRHSLVQHILLHRNPEFYKCNKCGKKLANKKSLKNHNKSHLYKDRVHVCKKCGKGFGKQEKLERHEKTHEVREHVCEHCGKVMRGSFSLKQHYLREHSGIPRQRVQCKKCGVFLADSSSLSFHNKYQHPKEDVEYKCDICGKISVSGYGLKRHKQYMHEFERKHKCTMCEKGFKTAQILRPNADDVNAKVICSSCWSTLDSFHKFYLQIEEAHVRLQAAAIDKEDLKVENEIAQHLCVSLDPEPFDVVTPELLEDTEEVEHIVCVQFKVKINGILSVRQGRKISLSIALQSTDIKLEVPEDTNEVKLPQDAGQCEAAEKKFESLKDSPPKRKHSTDSKKSADNGSATASATRSTRSRTLEKAYTADSDSSSDDDGDVGAERPNSPDWQDQNSGNDDDDSDYDDGASKAKKQKSTTKPTKKRGRPKKGEVRNSPRRKKLTSEEHSKKMERIQEYDEMIAKNMKLSCTICLAVFPNFNILKRHYRTVHNECGYAVCCGKKFRKRGVLVDHIYTHQNPDYFKCEKCGRVLANRKGLDCHMLTHDTEKQRIYQCDQCTLSFYTRPLLTRHLQTHISERNIKCPECDKFFSTQDILRTHINNVHNAAYTRICDQCGKSFRRPDAFRRHQLEHDGITQPLVPCEKCGVKLTSKYGLKRHMESMHPETEMTHICTTCGKVAPSAAALQRHISYMHKMERKYKCPMCDKAFKKTGGLKAPFF